MVERPVDALAIALVVGRVFPFLGDDAVERISTAHLRTRGQGQELAGKEDAQLDELAGRNVERTEKGAVGLPRDVAADRDRVTVDAVLGPGAGPGSVIVAVKRPSRSSHSSPHTLRLTSTTSS